MSSLALAEGIVPANQWACRLECGEVPADYSALNAGKDDLKKANIVVKAQKRLVSSAHVLDQCRSVQGYENCYLVSKDSTLPETYHFESEASAFKVKLPRGH